MIRLATKDDIEEVSVLWVAMIKELKNGWKPDMKAWVEKALGLLDSGMCEIIISIEENKVVGFIEGYVFYDPAISKNRSLGQYFYVVPDYRNTKVADSLYEEILVQSLIKKADSLELFCLPEMEGYWAKKGFSKLQSIMIMEI